MSWFKKYDTQHYMKLGHETYGTLLKQLNYPHGLDGSCDKCLDLDTSKSFEHYCINWIKVHTTEEIQPKSPYKDYEFTIAIRTNSKDIEGAYVPLGNLLNANYKNCVRLIRWRELDENEE